VNKARKILEKSKSDMESALKTAKFKRDEASREVATLEYDLNEVNAALKNLP
jgi:hypothetical protein